MRLIYADAAGKRQVVGETVVEITAVLAQKAGLLWLDLAGVEGMEAKTSLLEETFGFHPLAVDDALHEVHLPKLDDFGSYLYLVLQDVAYDRAGGMARLSLPELDLFLGRHFLVTYHLESVTAVERVWEVCQRDERWLTHGADHLLYRLIDEIVENFTTVLDQVETEVEQIAEQILVNPSPATLETLFATKRVSLQLRRALAPQRDVVNKLARDNFAMIGDKDRLFFRDVHDHLLRLYDWSDNVRDLVLGSMDLYLSVVNNRMNDVMKTLTVITTLFMPLSFLTGFFGMNFFVSTLPRDGWMGPVAFTAVLLAMLLLPLIMFTWMRRRAWL